MKSFSLALLFLIFFTSCSKNAELVKIPKGFQVYSEKIKSNQNPNLFFFQLHHCPNCSLVQNHLIDTAAFQELTKGYNRYFLELGQPLGKKLMDRFSIRGAPIFVLTDKNFNFISKSSYGFLGFSEFHKWLKTGNATIPKYELEAMDQITQKYKTLTVKPYEGMYQVFTELQKNKMTLSLKKESNVITIDKELAKFLDDAHIILQSWSKKVVVDSDKFVNHYRIGIAYMTLADLTKEINVNKYSFYLNESLNQIKQINSGDIKSDIGAYILQLSLYIKLHNDTKVEELVNEISNTKPLNKTLLYHGLAYSYLNFRDDCDKVMKYTDKLKLNEIPTDTDKIHHVFFRASCYKKVKNLYALKKEFNHLQRTVNPEVKIAFPKQIDLIKQMISELE